MERQNALMRACEEAGFLWRNFDLPTKTESLQDYNSTIAFRLRNSEAVYLLYAVRIVDSRRKGEKVV